MSRHRVEMRFGPRLTPLLRNILIALVTLYVTQLVLESWLNFPVTGYCALHAPMSPLGSTGMFRPWQPVSALLINTTQPTSAFFDWLMLWFFLPPALSTLGRKETAKLLAVSWAVGVLAAFALAWIGIVHASSVSVGITCITVCLIVVFAMSNPTAQIHLFFVLPIRAIWMLYLELFLLVLYFLAYRDLEAAVNLGGWTAAVGWMYGGGNLRQLYLRLRLRWLQRAKQRRTGGRFEVIDGGKGHRGGHDDWVH